MYFSIPNLMHLVTYAFVYTAGSKHCRKVYGPPRYVTPPRHTLDVSATVSPADSWPPSEEWEMKDTGQAADFRIKLAGAPWKAS